MKLQEIRDALEALATQRPGETIDEYSQRAWDERPRMPYKELPVSLQKTVRVRFTADTLRGFLQECYDSFDTITADIPAEDLDTIIIRTRNSAIYTIEQEAGNLAPMLYGNHATAAFEACITAYRNKAQEKQQKQQEQEQYEREREKAKQEGTKLPAKPQPQRAENLVSGGFYQYVISDKKYQHALTTQRNKNAYISLMQPDFFNLLDFKDGTITYDDEVTAIVKKYNKGKYADIQELDFPLLTQVYTAAVKASIRHDAYTITVSMPQFFREMGIDINAGNASDVMERLHSFEHCVGIMPGTQTISKLFTIIDVDYKNQTMTFAVPYIMRLYSILEEKNQVEKKTRQGELIEYKQPYHNTLVHSDIAKERNKTAVELVYLITTGLLQRGYVPDIQTYRKKDAKTQYPERITYSCRFRTLINDAPLLRGRIQSYKEVADKNKALRRAFEKAFQLIEKKTDARQWFINLQYNAVIPTMNTLDDELIFTHDGRNGDYRPKK